MSDVVEKIIDSSSKSNPLRRHGKITTRRREGVGVVVEKNEESRRTFIKNSCDLLTAITHTEILVVRCILLIKSESVTKWRITAARLYLLTAALVPTEN